MLAKTFLFVKEVLVIINVLTGLVLIHTNILSSPFSLSTACKQLQLQPELRHTGFQNGSVKSKVTSWYVPITSALTGFILGS